MHGLEAPDPNAHDPFAGRPFCSLPPLSANGLAYRHANHKTMPVSPEALLCAGVTALGALCLASVGLAETREEHTARGEYVARAAGCMSCHSEDLAGGYQVETPMGTIVASNISPSRDHGIGGYDRDDLARVLRDGVSPDRRLYPAMPYASFRGMSDADIDVLFVWLMDQEPVEEDTEEQTDLPFPFNIRTGVMAWNWLYLDDLERPVFDDPVLSRGAYLVDHLGHCGECHTPRNDLFAVQNDLYLAGEVIDGWLAPNLTSDPVSGLGAWATQDIVEYLRMGTAANIIQAAGPMAEFVQHATSHLDEEDLVAIASYLKTIPAVETRDQDIPLLVPEAERDTPRHSYNQIRAEMTEALGRTDLSEPEHLYLDHCAACHGVTGQGQPQAFYPPLAQNAALRREDTRNLLLVLAQGVPAGKLYRMPAMPGFSDELSHDQIATLANYTRTTFGGRENSALTGADVESAIAPADAMPGPLRTLQVAAWVGAIGFIVLVMGGGLIWWWLARRRGLKRKSGMQT